VVVIVVVVIVVVVVVVVVVVKVEFLRFNSLKKQCYRYSLCHYYTCRLYSIYSHNPIYFIVKQYIVFNVQTCTQFTSISNFTRLFQIILYQCNGKRIQIYANPPSFYSILYNDTYTMNFYSRPSSISNQNMAASKIFHKLKFRMSCNLSVECAKVYHNVHSGFVASGHMVKKI